MILRRAGERLGIGILLATLLQAVAATAVIAWPYHIYMAVKVDSLNNLVYLSYNGNRAIGYQRWVLDLADGSLIEPGSQRLREAEDREKMAVSDGVRIRYTEVPALEEFVLSVRFTTDSVGVDTLGSGVARYKGHLVLEAGGQTRTVNVITSCDTLIRVQGVWGIPGRSELVVVLCYKGLPGKCDEIDVPILMLPD